MKHCQYCGLRHLYIKYCVECREVLCEHCHMQQHCKDCYIHAQVRVGSLFVLGLALMFFLFTPFVYADKMEYFTMDTSRMSYDGAYWSACDNGQCHMEFSLTKQSDSTHNFLHWILYTDNGKVYDYTMNTSEEHEQLMQSMRMYVKEPLYTAHNPVLNVSHPHLTYKECEEMGLAVCLYENMSYVPVTPQELQTYVNTTDVGDVTHVFTTFHVREAIDVIPVLEYTYGEVYTYDEYAWFFPDFDQGNQNLVFYLDFDTESDWNQGQHLPDNLGSGGGYNATNWSTADFWHDTSSGGLLINNTYGWVNHTQGHPVDFQELGLDNIVNLGDSFDTDGNNSFTIAMYLNYTNIANTHQFFIVSDNVPNVELQGRTNGSIRFRMRDTGSNERFAWAPPINNGSWVHLAAVVNDAGSGNLRVDIWEDGVLRSVTEWTGISGTTWPQNECNESSARPCAIGSQQGLFHYEGFMDEFRVYNVTLTEGEIQQLVNVVNDSLTLPPTWDETFQNGTTITRGQNYTFVFNWTATNPADSHTNDTDTTWVVNNVSQIVTLTFNASIVRNYTFETSIYNADGNATQHWNLNVQEQPLGPTWNDTFLNTTIVEVGQNYTFILNWTGALTAESLTNDSNTFSVVDNLTKTVNLTVNAFIIRNYTFETSIFNVDGNDTQHWQLTVRDLLVSANFTDGELIAASIDRGVDRFFLFLVLVSVGMLSFFLFGIAILWFILYHGLVISDPTLLMFLSEELKYILGICFMLIALFTSAGFINFKKRGR